MSQNIRPAKNNAKASRNSARQSDLQPVYDVLNVVSPANLQEAYQRVERHTRLMIMIMLASIILSISMIKLVQIGLENLRVNRGAFLMDATQAPYELDARYLPFATADQGMMLQANLNEYALLPVVEAADLSVEATEALAAPISQSLLAVGKCLTEAAPVDDDKAPLPECIGYFATEVLSGDYQRPEMEKVNLIAGRFADHQEATSVVNALMQQARKSGWTENYAIGIGEVDFFFSMEGSVYNLTWSRNAWVYSLSSISLEEIKMLAESLPYGSNDGCSMGCNQL